MKLELLILTLALMGLSALAHVIPRTDFTAFISCYAVLLGAYAWWVYTASKTFKKEHWLCYLGAALLLRLVFGTALPTLSDDFWRYLWDGRLLSHGINPYQFVPAALLEQPIYEQAHLGQLYPYLNSPNYYSVYPPFTQFFFATATYFFPSNVGASVFFLRIMTIALEMGTIVLLVHYLQQEKKASYWAFVYAFNPLIIIEISGNLHTESLLLFFLVMLLFLWSKKQYYCSALACSLAVAAKLIPLIILPLLCWRLWFKKGVVYGLIVGGINLLLFALFYDIDLLIRTRESMSLYFQHFEFNASVYYFLRYQLLYEYWWLWEYHAYFMKVYYIEETLRLDWYAIIRKSLPVVSIASILGITFRHQSIASIANSCLCIFTLYFCFSTTVHPWYISSLVLLAAMTGSYYPLVWSAAIAGTYISYQAGGFEEQTWVILLEYGLVIATLCWEWWYKRPRKVVQVATILQKTAST